MSVFKCKMCGGALAVTENQSTVTCEYCGTSQTLPKLDNEKKINLYDRANHLRRNNEFDKAMSLYEQILNEDGTDAESYWSLVLCHYGIEYVEDPKTRKRMPTINRTQFTSIYDDSNYKAALEYADTCQKTIYEQEASAINKLQKEIIEIFRKEEPFDVFICYKESDNNGRRTPDSVLANDLYHQLTKEGFKVFFSRITLEDKLGVAYEPYIFAALQSARVMVVLGTRTEYFHAVWVKNEWSRYLSLVKKSEGQKVLIPAYRDMDPYDLPEEFSHLQAQDMSKLGFMQDLIRGIKKLAQPEERTVIVKETEEEEGRDIEPLLKRVFLFLEDKEWEDADEYCEKVLDADPECAEAYLGKLMVEMKCSYREHLKECAEPFDGSRHYQKIQRFGTQELKEKVEADCRFIKERNHNAYLEGVYEKAGNCMNSARTEAEYQEASKLFQEIGGFKDAGELSVKCLELAEAARKDSIYQEAEKEKEEDTETSLYRAIRVFDTISGWRDADEQIAWCESRIAEIKRLEEEQRKQELYNEAEIAAALNSETGWEKAIRVYESIADFQDAVQKAEQCKKQLEEFQKIKKIKEKRNKRNRNIILGAIILIFIGICIWTTYLYPMQQYKNAAQAFEAEDYEKAIEIYQSLRNYEESAKKLPESKYYYAGQLYEEGKYKEARQIYEELGDYEDSKEKIGLCYSKFQPGDFLYFGSYEQDYIWDNGKEKIQWRVLANEDGKLLVISELCLDKKKYHSKREVVSWEESDLRRWLNEDFMNTAFTSEEQELIRETEVSNWNYEADEPEEDTTDKIFLLNIEEAERYFEDERERKVSRTQYANDIHSEEPAFGWWLRSSSEESGSIMQVAYWGEIDDLGIYSFMSNYVRPAMWIEF